MDATSEVNNGSYGANFKGQFFHHPSFFFVSSLFFSLKYVAVEVSIGRSLPSLPLFFFSCRGEVSGVATSLHFAGAA